MADPVDNYLTINTTPVNVKNGLPFIPQRYYLGQNYPNPFSSSTNISFSIPKPEFVVLKIYDRLGREIQTLVNNFQQMNTYSVTFDANNLTGGIYYYKLQAGNEFTEVKKMLL